ncbi:cell filamentation protein Fic [Salipaludibacillus keqinensis]|uniref:protein adenylyltransferase n=1 Tax=Salipaludibacillus keqinensis TaxID=2045207 RepID=A0A323TJR4_9BACI|nr:Fic family protein [Salipaludibacillus keqinensis]PYZ93857.1 cell filamentation protein Fic [Salipaludibacillus keqinensis]
MSKYGTGESKYCYPGTSVLINHFEVKDDERLAKLDAILTSKRLSELQINPIKGDFSFNHLNKIHYYLFQDIYPFAGVLRSENISKGNFTFAPALHLQESGNQLFSRLQQEIFDQRSKDEICHLLAFYMAEINVLHPFRDGNGRSCREFIRVLALTHGYTLDWTKVDKRKILQASIDSTTRLGPLKKVMSELIE